MLDFVHIEFIPKNKTEIIVSPEFSVEKSDDLMVKGNRFYAVWDEDKGVWSKNEVDVQRLIDRSMREEIKKYKETSAVQAIIRPKYLGSFSSKKWIEWQSFVKSLPDNYHDLDSKIIFSNTKVKKTDYVTRRLPYPLEKGSHKAYDELMDTLYSPEERDKIEWAIGAVISGDSQEIQKFLVFYGDAGTGKSTVLNIIQSLFEGYYTFFEAKSLASSNNTFALESFRDNPLIAIQHDGDLSRIEDNTKLNSLASHEYMLMNEKHKSQYTMKFRSFLFMGTNRPVKISEAKSGILRRLIDVSPTGNKIPFFRYRALLSQINFERGAIAYHCLEKYKKMGISYYDNYKPNTMMGATNDFYNFIEDNYDFFSEDEVVLDAAWAEYKKYVADANISFPFSRRVFKEELKTYYKEYKERYKGKYKVYIGFKKEKFDYISANEAESKKDEEDRYFLNLDKTESIFDVIFSDCIAQEAKADGSPKINWSDVKTTLKDINTKELHYVLVPENLIVIDFDLRNKDGNKDPVANLEAASKFPPTYAEYSKSGGGIHLHYYYDGDVLQLSRIFEEHIEVKVFKKSDGTRGYSSLRRKLSYCNDIPIATINSGLPLKGAKEMVNFDAIKSEKALRTMIIRNLNKEYHPDTTSSVDFIFKILEDAYNGPLGYDVSDLRPAVLSFAMKSTNQSAKCVATVAKMHFMSKEASESSDAYEKETPIVFFDIECFSNLLVVCWKMRGAPREQTVRMINPSPEDVKALFKYRLVGFNNRRYDNHILYAASLGYSNARIYDISQNIITNKDKDKNCFFREAYNLSYTDIYDFASKKQSLKKWEIELGIHHQELGLPWDKPVPEDMWDKVCDYCVNDVMATEAVFEARAEDFKARQILADLADGSVNDTTNSLTTKIVFGFEKHPQLVYTDLATGRRSNGEETPSDILGAFPGYEYKFLEDGKPHNMYMGTDVGFGGYVYGEPGMYTNVALLDVASMHPTSIVLLNKLGPYTQKYADLRAARVYIKHGDYESAGRLFNGKLTKYLKNEDEADALSKALKLPINSFYGLSAASFDNPARDKRDKNNIIALRGALFMRTLQEEVKKKGFRVISIRTDSLKIPDATDEIISFVMEFGKKYGYTFEHEATYEKLCLVNQAVYIAKYDEKGIRNKGGKHAGEWTATGTQFQVPYVFKTLFSKENLEHSDLCETKETKVGSGLYLDMNEGMGPNEHNYQFIGKVGQFCPIKPGCGGGVLVREMNGKYNAATGTKKPKGSFDKKAGEEETYRWLESETVEVLNKWDDVDHSYYKVLVDEAVETISQYGDFEWFVSDEPVAKPVNMNFMNLPEEVGDEVVELPFD